MPNQSGTGITELSPPECSGRTGTELRYRMPECANEGISPNADAQLWKRGRWSMGHITLNDFFRNWPLKLIGLFGPRAV
jgi:hypothetical protein